MSRLVRIRHAFRLHVTRLVCVMCAIVLAVPVFAPAPAAAYSENTHYDFEDAIIRSLELDGKQAQADFLKGYSGILAEGMMAADRWDWSQDGYQYFTLQHFHDPWSHQGNTSWPIPGGRTAEVYVDEADTYWNANSDPLGKGPALFSLGIALHMLQDATVPMHTDDNVEQYAYGHAHYEQYVEDHKDRLLEPPQPGMYQVSVKEYHPDGHFKTPYHPDGIYADNTPFTYVDYAAHRSREFYDEYKSVWTLYTLNQLSTPAAIWATNPMLLLTSKIGGRIYQRELDKACEATAQEMVPLAVSLSTGLVSNFLSDHGVGGATYEDYIDDAPGMGEYRWYDQDFGWTHEVPSGRQYTSATLEINAWDVDASDGEVNIVYVYAGPVLIDVGPLEGYNNLDHTTSFDIEPTWIVDGKLPIWVDIDSTHNKPTWAVTINWSRLTVGY